MPVVHHLNDREMVEALEKLPPVRSYVVLNNCQFCGIPVVIAGVLRSLQHKLPPTPSTTGWRAFERAKVHSPAAWRSSKRFGFIPSASGVGFLPHACPRSSWTPS